MSFSGKPTSANQLILWNGTEFYSGFLTNSNIDSSATIQGSKINPDFGSQAVVTTGSITGGSLVSNSLDTASATTLSLGTVNANAITIGSVSMTTTVAGNLTVAGTTTTIDSTVVNIVDRVINLNYATAASNAPVPSQIAGFEVQRGSSGGVYRNAAGLFWDESTSKFQFAFNTAADDVTLGAALAIKASGATLSALSTGVVHSDSSGNLTSSLVVDADVSATAAISVSKIASGTAAQFLQSNGTPTTVWATMSGDATLGNTGVLTLANTAVTPNTYGDGTHVGQFTVDSKGRLTFASNVLITGAAPTGSAGGDLSGSYPNPTVAKVDGVSYPASPSTNTVPVITSSNTVTYQQIADAQVSSSAAIAYSKLNLTNSIVDADINSAAAIAGTKISPNFGAQNIQTTGTLTAKQSVLGSTTSVNSISGSLIFTTRTASSNFTIDTTTTDLIVYADTSSTAFNLTLPTPTNGRTLIIKDSKQTFATNNLTVVRHASEKIDGVSASLVLATNNEEVILTSDGTDWYTNLFSEPPSGAAGGDLSGTYPNPTVVKIQNNTVTSGALTKGQFFVATSTSNWAATTLSGDVSESASTAGLLTVTGIQGNTFSSGAPTKGQFVVATSTSNYGPITISGDITESSSTAGLLTVVNINGASVPAAGSLTTGNVLQVNGSSSLTYAAVNLGGGANFVTGTLPTANQAAQSLTLTGDVTSSGGTTASASTTVAAISGSSPIAITPVTLQWIAGAASATLKQADKTTNSGTGAVLTIQAQNETGTTSIGGQLALTSGTGTTVAGSVVVQTGGTTRLTANATGVITVANLGTGVVHADSSGNLTSSTIVDADVSASAAITVSKLAPGTADQLLDTNHAGTTTEWFTLGGDATFASHNLTLANTAVTPGTYGDGTHVGQFTVDSKGRLTFAANVTITGAAPTGAAGGDLSGTYPNPTVAKIQNNPVSSTSLGSAQDGYVATWVNADNQIEFVPASSVIVDGQDYQFSNTSSDVSGYDQLLDPASGSEGDLSASVTSGGGTVLIKAFATTSSSPDVVLIPAGLWEFNFYAYASLTGAFTTQLVFDVYTRTAGGSETLLFSATSGSIGVTSVSLFTLLFNNTTDTYIASTTRLVIKVSAKTSSVLAVTAHFVFDGATHASLVRTPIAGDSLILGGDLSGTTASATVAKINGTTVTTAGGSLTTGQVLRVTGSSSSDWGALDLSNSSATTGTLSNTKQAAQTMSGDVTGTTAANTVIALTGSGNTVSFPSGSAVGNAETILFNVTSAGSGTVQTANVTSANSAGLTITTGTTTTSGNSGALNLSSGSAAGTAGNVLVQTGGTTKLTVSPTTVTVASGEGLSSAGGVANFDWSSSSGTFDTSTGNVTLRGNTSISGSKTFVTGSGTVTINGATSFVGVAVTASGAASFDLSGGSGIFKTSTGSVTVGPGTTTMSGTTTFTASGTALTVNNASLLSGAVTFSSSITQSGGAVSLHANAASDYTTSSGALTLTSAAAATWSTGAGVLSLSGFTGVSLQTNTTEIAKVDANKFYTVKGYSQHVTIKANADTPYTVVATDNVLAADVSGGVLAVNLPTSPAVGDSYAVKDYKGAAATSNITVDSGSGNKIDAAQTFVIDVNYGSINLVCVATSPNKWMVM
jgi:hypothetical protein